MVNTAEWVYEKSHEEILRCGAEERVPRLPERQPGERRPHTIETGGAHCVALEVVLPHRRRSRRERERTGPAIPTHARTEVELHPEERVTDRVDPPTIAVPLERPPLRIEPRRGGEG